MEAPAIRNSWARVALRRVRSFPSDHRHAVLDRIGRATQNSIARARSDDWLPVEFAVEVCDALVEVLGNTEAVKFWHDVVLDSWVGGLLEPLAASVKDTGKDGSALGLIGVAPAAWALSARDCGEVRVIGDGHAVRLEVQGLPTIVRESVGIQVMYAGALKAMLAFSKLAASVEIQAEGAGPLAFKLEFR